jgi:hypothetical protein
VAKDARETKLLQLEALTHRRCVCTKALPFPCWKSRPGIDCRVVVEKFAMPGSHANPSPNQERLDLRAFWGNLIISMGSAFRKSLFRNRKERAIVQATKKMIPFAFVAFMASLHTPDAAAQQPEKQIRALQTLLRIEQKLSPDQRNFFSGALSGWLAFAHSVLDKPAAGPDDDGGRPPFTLARTLSTTAPAAAVSTAALPSGTGAPGGAVRISNPDHDLQLSRFTGFTQNTSSSAWCGHNVVTGFQSTLSELSTSVIPFVQDPSLPVNSSSSLGVALSTNDGGFFADLGVLNPGPTTTSINTVMFGNPVVVCSGPSKFYYLTSPFFTSKSDADSITSFAGVGLSVSTDGGRQWADPAAVVNKNAAHILDRAWLAADAHDSARLYVAYMDFDLEGFFSDPGATPRCPNTLRNAIELVSSGDGGKTWSAPVIVREDCVGADPVTNVVVNNTPFAPSVAVGGDGKVYVSYAVFAVDGSITMKFRSSSSHGSSFNAEINVTDVVPTGSGDFLQTLTLNSAAPAMSVDLSRPGRDTVYIAWSDGRDNSQVDVLTASGTYNFSDILISKSTDGGTSWSAPKPVSPTPHDFRGAGRDQIQPAIAVNGNGTLAVCYYDRRNDMQNNALDRYCSVSRDHGFSFHDIRQTGASWAPIENADLFIAPHFLGGYDTLAPHPEPDGDSFFGSFQIIQNAVVSIQGRDIQREE